MRRLLDRAIGIVLRTKTGIKRLQPTARDVILDAPRLNRVGLDALNDRSSTPQGERR